MPAVKLKKKEGDKSIWLRKFILPIFAALPQVNQIQKLQKLIMAAGFNTIDMEKKLVAIKMHFGEPGNLAFLRPNYAKAVADLVWKKGGIPFLADGNALYPGSRKNAPEHLAAAFENGFSPLSTGCQVIIADGLRGLDEVEVPVVNGEYTKTARIGRAVMDADVVISLTHFKGHECTGFGGALKNLGMGCGSRAGKMDQHNNGKPVVSTHLCRGCRLCSKECGQDAISYDERGKAHIDPEKCAGCGRCIGRCNFDAISNRRRQRQRRPGLQDCGIHPGRVPSPPLLPYQPCHGCKPLLRLPRRKRYAYRAGYWHVREL